MFVQFDYEFIPRPSKILILINETEPIVLTHLPIQKEHDKENFHNSPQKITQLMKSKTKI